MMKNKMMRAASILLVAVLLSTCAISGTFAKYVTTASGTDTARVAKWGIQMNSSGESTFVDEYKMETDNSKITVDGAADVVAPGTTGSATYTITGTPETAYQITFSATDIQDVFLGNGKYTYLPQYSDMSKTINTDSDDANINTKYYPIKYTITIVAEQGTINNAPTGVYNTLKAALDALSATTIDFQANKGGVTVTINWNWAFDEGDDNADLDQNAHINNAYDTILGDLAAKPATGDYHLTATGVNGTGTAEYNLTVAYTLKMTATQVD